MTPLSFYAHSLNQIRDLDRYRELSSPKSTQAILSDFSTNDYLGLSTHPEVITAACEAGWRYGAGATGSRILSGNKELFSEFEERIAHDKGLPEALLFNSGYQANLSILPALWKDPRTLVFFNKRNHASLYEGVALSKAEMIRYRDEDHLESLLKKLSLGRVPWVVTETVFGMDGDVVDLASILELCHRFGCALYLDEAHGTGLLGTKGYGLSTQYDLSWLTCVVMGTLSKAIGCSGAYIATSGLIKAYLINACKGFIYSTGPSPMVMAAAFKAWSLVPEKKVERHRIFAYGEEIRNRLKDLTGEGSIRSTTPIIPIFAPEKYKAFLSAGVKTSLVRPPTVRTSRLRIAVTANHQREDIDRLLSIQKIV